MTDVVWRLLVNHWDVYILYINFTEINNQIEDLHSVEKKFTQDVIFLQKCLVVSNIFRTFASS